MERGGRAKVGAIAQFVLAMLRLFGLPSKRAIQSAVRDTWKGPEFKGRRHVGWTTGLALFQRPANEGSSSSSSSGSSTSSSSSDSSWYCVTDSRDMPGARSGLVLWKDIVAGPGPVGVPYFDYRNLRASPSPPIKRQKVQNCSVDSFVASKGPVQSRQKLPNDDGLPQPMHRQLQPLVSCLKFRAKGSDEVRAGPRHVSFAEVPATSVDVKNHKRDSGLWFKDPGSTVVCSRCQTRVANVGGDFAEQHLPSFKRSVWICWACQPKVS